MNPYDILGIPRGSSKEVARAAYRKLAMRWHPDRVSITEVVEAQTRFVQVKAAWEQIDAGYFEAPPQAQRYPSQPVYKAKPKKAPRGYYKPEAPTGTWRDSYEKTVAEELNSTRPRNPPMNANYAAYQEMENARNNPRAKTYKTSTWEAAPPAPPMPKIVQAFEQEWLQSKQPKKNLGEYIARCSLREANEGFNVELTIDGEKKQFPIPPKVPNGFKKTFDVDGGKVDVTIKFTQSGFDTHTMDKAIYEQTFVNGVPASVVRSGALGLKIFVNDKEFERGTALAHADFLGKAISIKIPPRFNPHNLIKVEGAGYYDWYPGYERAGDKRSDLYVQVIPYADGMTPVSDGVTPIF